MRRGQEHGARAEMVRASFRWSESIRLARVRAADNREVIAKGRERLQRIREFEAGPLLRRTPVVLARADLRATCRSVYHLDARQTAAR